MFLFSTFVSFLTLHNAISRHCWYCRHCGVISSAVTELCESDFHYCVAVLMTGPLINKSEVEDVTVDRFCFRPLNIIITADRTAEKIQDVFDWDMWVKKYCEEKNLRYSYVTTCTEKHCQENESLCNKWSQHEMLNNEISVSYAPERMVKNSSAKMFSFLTIFLNLLVIIVNELILIINI